MARTFDHALALTILALGLCLPGCGGGVGEQLYPVAGHVVFAGQPLKSGSISFRPDAEKGNKSLHHPTGSIDATGRYQLFTAGVEGAPSGAYKVVVFANEELPQTKSVHPGMPKSIIPERYNDPKSTPLAREVVADAAAGTYDLVLEK